MRTSAVAKFLVGLSLAGFLAGVGAPGLRAQWYGRNKVQYQKFDFKIMKTRHFDVYFYLQDEQTVKMACLMAERWYSRLSRMFNHELKGRQPLILYGSSPEFQQTTVIPEIMGEGTGGVTESFKRRIVLPYGASLAETDHVIGHELVHAFQYDIMAQGHSDQARGNDAALRIPLWFIEGMAEYLSIGPVDPNTSMWMRDAVRRKELPQIKKLDNSYKFFPYRWGQAVWSYITGRWGDEIIGKMMKSVGRAGDYEIILESMLGIKLKQLSADWHKSMQDAYGPLLEKTQMADKIAKPLFQGTRANPYNIAPSISPDGKSLVFLSTRDLFSIDLYLADAETGKIRRKIISTAVDPHFESIQFIKSAGSWDAKGEKFVFGGVAKGRPGPDHRRHEEGQDRAGDPLRRAGRDPQPGLVAGRPLHHLHRPGRGRLRPLHLRPQGQRPQADDARRLRRPPARLVARTARRSPSSRSGSRPTSSGSTSGTTSWPSSTSSRAASRSSWPSPTARTSTRSGPPIPPPSISSPTRTARPTSTGSRSPRPRSPRSRTSTRASPASPSSARPSRSPRRRAGSSSPATMTATTRSIRSTTRAFLQGQPFLAQFDRNPAILPPRAEPEGSLLGLLKNPLFGLPKDTNFAIVPYKPKLGLDYVSPPNIAVGVDRYGTYGAGGLAAYWSDMLGYHTIVTTAFTGSRLIDTSGVLGYLNNRSRFNWGAAAQRIVYPYPYFLFYQDIDGLYHEIEDIYRLINYDISLFGSYPFSQVSRFQLSAGYRIQDFNHTIYERIYDPSGFLLDYQKYHPNDTPPSMSFAYLTGGYFYDTGIFGATSPILGQNIGLSVTPALGKVTFTTAMADFRKYIMPVKPFTLAFRALHMGRYGKDAEDTRFYPLYIALLGPRPRLRVDQHGGAHRIQHRSDPRPSISAGSTAAA